MRTWISCYAAPDRTACAAFIEESRMQFVNAIKLNRKSREPGAPVQSLWVCLGIGSRVGECRFSQQPHQVQVTLRLGDIAHDLLFQCLRRGPASFLPQPAMKEKPQGRLVR